VLAHDVTVEKAYKTQHSLSNFVREIERRLLAIYFIQLEKMEEQRRQCLESLQNLGSEQVGGHTAEQRTGELAEVLAEKLVNIEKQIKIFQVSQNSLFDFISDLQQQIAAIDLINTHNDIAAPNPHLAL
jgi:hypothetical protein